ncbi:MAG TPA: spore germination protein GerW family protein [Nitrososphaerales archaeon]|nr:spore germination protein GerW family protein [Nitrososphaerales archaeon]
MSMIADDVKATVDELLRAVSTKNVISDPLEVGDKVVITVTKMGLGFGTGKGESKGTTGPGGVGEAVGGAVGVTPIAIIVINKSISGMGGIEVKHLAPPSGIGKALGEIASSITQAMSESKNKNQQQQTHEKPQF